MRRHAHIALVAALALTISACAEDEEDTQTTAAESTAAEQDTDAASESEAAPMETEETDSAATEAASTSETTPITDEAAAVDTIPATALEAPPAEIGEFTLSDDSGPALIYANGAGDTVTVDTQTLSSPYDDLVSEISTDNVEAGAGSCGLNPGGTSAVCYQRTEDGVLTMTANADLLDVLAQFANEYAVAASS